MDIILKLVAVAVLISLSALLSGLTLGLMSLSTHELRRKASLGHEHARKVYPLRRRSNELLVSLIVANTLVNAVLTVFLNSFLYSVLAIIVATILITLFGEILPQAYLRKHGLYFGAKLAPYINNLMVFTKPLSAPLGRFLDKLIGEEAPDIYTKKELLKIMDEHAKSGSGKIEPNDLSIAKHALSFADKKVKDAMVPINKVIKVHKDDVLTTDLISKLHKTGHRRFPVEDKPNQFVGWLYIDNIADLDKLRKGHKTVGDFMDTSLAYVNSLMSLDYALNAFLKTKLPAFIVINTNEQVLGIITIEDIIDEALGTVYEKDFDRFHDKKEVAKIR